VSGIVSDFKKNLQGSDIDSVRELAIEAKKQGFTLSDLAPHIRLHNFIRSSGASEEKVESFVTNVSYNDIPQEKVIEYLNQIHEIAKEESIPLDQASDFVKQKIEEKKKIELKASSQV
jgi:DNA-binding transcriptional regulator YhcF (GntR family)